MKIKRLFTVIVCLMCLGVGMSNAQVTIYGEPLYPSSVSGTAGDVTVTDNGNSTVTISTPKAYGELWGQDYTLDITGTDTYAIVNSTNGVGGDGIINGLSASVGISNVTGLMTIAADGAGVYSAKVTASFNASATNTVHMAFFVDGVEQGSCHFERKLGTGNDVGDGMAQCLLNLSAGQVVDLRAENSANTDIEFYHIEWYIERIDN